MYTFAIIDDNEDDQNKIYKCMSEECQVNNIDFECQIYSSSLNFHFDIEYDAVFIDIDMPKENGIQFARRLNQQYETKIIFITNYSNYLHASLDAHPFQFINKENLKFESIRVFKQLFNELNKNNYTLTVNEKNEKKMIQIKDIYYIESDDHLLHIYLKNNNQDLYIWDTLSHIYNQLRPYGFIQINRSTIINMKYIKNINTKNICLKNNIMLKLGLRYSVDLKTNYPQYLLGDYPK